MDGGEMAKGTINLDVTLTWIDKILCKLQLLMHDYPGLNNLKLELRHLQTILPCARYLSSEEPSILSPFCEKLQNFFGLLRSEDRILSVLAEEISRFREMVRSFQEQTCKWNTVMFDSILDKLQPLLSSYPGADDSLSVLKVELKLTKTFFLCFINYRKQMNTKSPASDVKSLIYGKASQFYYLLLRLEEALLHHEMAEAFSIFQESLKNYRQQIQELYTCMADFIVPGSPWLASELREFLHSLSEALADIIIWGEVWDPRFENLIEPLQEKLKFLKSFLHFATMGVEDPLPFQQFSNHCQFYAVKAANLCYTYWFFRDDTQVYNDLQLRSSELLEYVKPTEDQASQNYIDTLATSRESVLSFTLIDDPDIHIVGEFVDSLLHILSELLDWGSSYLVSMELQMQMLGEGLKFLRTILKQQLEKFNCLPQGMKNDVIGVVYEAADVIFQLYKLGREESLARDMDPRIFDLIGKIDSMMVEVAQKFQLSSPSNLLASNEAELIDLMLGRLKELASQDVDLTSSVQSNIWQVQKGLQSLKSFIDNVQDHHRHDKKLSNLWRCAVELAYKAEFVIDSLTARGMSPYSLMLFDALAKEISLFIETSNIDEKQYSPRARKTSKISTRVPSQGARSASNEIVVGFDDEAKIIIEQLMTKKKELDITFIVGMPGLGKTTLARKVYQDPFITRHFRVRAWCYVSQVCSRKDVLLDILRSIEQSHQDTEKNEDDLVEKLNKHLIGNRYLIVLDDIWDSEAWNFLKSIFPQNAFGSRILLTGRSQFTIKQPSCRPHPLRRLTEDECWELLQKKLHYRDYFPPALRDTGRRIAKNCQGLPFSVIIVAGILANVEEDAWEEVANSLSSNILCGSESRRMLELSYRHLPDFLKPCLLYMAAFPDGKEICVQRLMWLWVAEGFIQGSELELKGLEDVVERKEIEDIAEDNVMALVNRNLVVVSKKGSIGKVKTCQIHDLLHEFCLVKSKEETFLQMLSGRDDLLRFDEPPNLRRLCIFSQPKHFVKSRLFCSRLRSLLFHSQGAGGNSGTIYSSSFVFRAKLLGVLDLVEINLGFVFPDAITTLFKLRYLAVRGEMKSIPSSISKLSYLECLVLLINHKGLSGFSLPVTLWDMHRLRHIEVCGCLVDLNMGEDNLESSSSLENLATFSAPKLYLGKTMDRIMGKLPNLRELKCNVLDSQACNEDSEGSVEIQFPSKLEILKLTLCNIANLHRLRFDFPSNLKQLSLVGFSWNMISSIWKLQKLEVLKLLKGSDDGVEEWNMEEEEFPNLKFLKLGYCEIGRWTGSGDHFPRLRMLVLEGCNHLEELPCCLETLSLLDLIKVHRCPDSVGTIVREIAEEMKSWGNEDVKIMVSEEFEKD